jgi:hypothetical protein
MRDLKSDFEQMEAAKAALLKSLASLDDATLNRKPDAATWSILQVIAHLTKAEAGTLQYIRKKTQDPAGLPKAGILPWFRIAALVAGIHSPFKFKAPKSTAEVPETGDLQTASLAWAQVRMEWQGFIDAFPEVLRDRAIFRHPFVGLLGPAQVMIFLNQHLGNHTRQIARIRRTLNA